MADRETGNSGGKGFFGQARLAVARVYTLPTARRKVIVAGGALVGLLVVFALFDLTLGGAAFVSSGKLSTSHATIDPGKSCNNCHSPLAGVTDTKCAGCHERYDDPVGVFSFASHKAVADLPLPDRDGQAATRDMKKSDCADCHLEHKGRLASITDVRNSTCLSCHDFDSFEDDHPEFDHVRLGFNERPGLVFPHIMHVRQLLKQHEIATIENACASCHSLKDEAKNFEPLSFDRHCSACHLGQESETEAFPIVVVPASGVLAPSASVGVETLESIRKRRPLGSDWTSRMNDRGFNVQANEVTKLRVEHADPWILHNLALQRSRLVEPGLSDLLAAIPASASGYSVEHYREAAATLEQMNKTLGAVASEGDDEIQEEVNLVKKKIRALRLKIEDQESDLNVEKFAPVARKGVSDELREQILDFAAELGDACWKCHVSPKESTRNPQAEPFDTSIVSPQIDQRVLLNARFDHSAHVIQRGCLDCHTAIPFAEFANNRDKVPSGVEDAPIINIPGISNCQECHSSKLASDQCVGCHDYHPHQDGRARFVTRGAPASEAVE